MNSNKTGGPAFPLQYDPYVDHPAHGRVHRSAVGEEIQEGMTLRDYFAAQATVGLLVRSGETDANFFADKAYAIADAMLKKREAS